MVKEITGNLEQVESRERHINLQIEAPLTSYRQMSQVCQVSGVHCSTCENIWSIVEKYLLQVLAQAKEQQRQAGASLVEKTRALAQLTEELEGVKAEMETRGSSMTDGAPLVSIKRALARVRREIGGMDVMIGVLQQGLLQAAVKDNMKKFNDEY